MAVTTAASYDETVTDIEETLGFVPGFMEAVPEEALVHEWPVFKQYTLGESEIPPKYRELIQFAVASSQHCKYCSAFHSGAAELNGATEEEVAEAGVLTGLTQRWSAMLHAQQYDFDTFVDEFNQIGAFLEEQQQAAD
jgi:AhpD family alkylhydroperoxidase